MRNKVRGRVSGRSPKNLPQTLLVPAALAVTVISAACGDDEEKKSELASCYAVQDAGTCQVCIGPTGRKDCAGLPQFCAWNPEGGVCIIVPA